MAYIQQPSSSPSTNIPYRQIRAYYDSSTITVYQAYSAEIAIPAIKQQKLNASPAFSTSRMTWIKPSWAWVLYRSGYSYKDDRQSHILALKLKHETFTSLLRRAVLTHGGGSMKKDSVRVQWDPERTVRIGKLPYRSIQIGIPGQLVEEYLDGIMEIEDVSEKAKELKSVLDEDVKGKLRVEVLYEMGLVPDEREYKVDEELEKVLGMDEAVQEAEDGKSEIDTQ